jgi:tetratricopeptide (TPR) repeat protein
MNSTMKTFLLPLVAASMAWLACPAAAQPVLVENGQPRAEIVIAEKPLRTVRLAAQELQDGIQKISGARLPIVTQPTGKAVKIFVGASAHSPVKAEGLVHGAYRIATGADWMALIGEDTEFTPIEPWAKNNTEIVNGKAQAEWEKITGATWGLPNILIYKSRFTLPGDIGRPTAQAAEKAVPLQMWDYDERGSFNAVVGFLSRLGARWYLPGELGEVLPDLKTIPLPKLDETVRPDMPQRRFSYHGGVHGRDASMWFMRLGVRDPYGIQDAHGLDSMTNRAEVFAAHPDWFAMYGGKRRFDVKANNQLCYSNEELFQESVRYVRAQFDHFKMSMVSVMPPDGYTAICQCQLCVGKDSPERDQRGLASDYVWGFVNRVAKEVAKTHPNGKVLNCAYGIYSLPPLKIAKLEPNVVVSIVGARVPRNNKPEQQEECRQLREAWVAKTHNPIINFENYPFIDRGWYLPAFTPHAMGESVNATKGISLGEDISLTVRQEPDISGIGFNHFQVYFTARMYWGGKDADVDAMFREYCRLFYGPAEAEMRTFFEYCEANWQEMEKDKLKADEALALFEKAKTKADATSVYGRRIALIDDFLKGLRSKSLQLSKVRGPVPVLRLVNDPREKIVIDGTLDEDAWVNSPVSSTVRLRELQTGRQPTFGTTVKTTWIGNDLYFAIRCDEKRGEKPNIGTTKKDDSALWYGDAVEVLLETESRSYYQIAISPGGAIADLDRGAARDKWFTWNSNAEVAKHIAGDHWTIEMRLPITKDENDPLNQIIGRKPDKSLPWHINICRQRIREDGTEHSAFSPTGTDGFHEVLKLATFYYGNSFEFDHGPPEDDFLEAMRIAADFARTGKREEAFTAYTAAAERKCTDLQKSHALELAAGYARHLRKLDVADSLTARIPIDAVKKAVQMQAMLDSGKAAALIETFGSEDIAKWPFWKRGDGLHRRGRAYSIMKAGEKAEADLTAALDWTSEPRVHDDIWLLLGQNREMNLNQDTQALAAYHEIVADRVQIGGASEFAALQGIASIQTRQGKFDDALKTLNRAEPDKLQGVWKTNILKSIEAVNQARKPQ